LFFGEWQGDWRISESDIRHGPSHIFNLTVWPGEFVAIVGESGSGKSTLMNIIGVLDKPTSGEYTLDGVDIHKADDDELAGIESIVLCAIGGVIGVGLGIGHHHCRGVQHGHRNVLWLLPRQKGRQDGPHRRPAVRIRVPFVICLSAQN